MEELRNAGPQIDRTVLARIRGCQDTTLLEGAACTNCCEFFNTCNIKRTPLLVQTRNIKAVFEKNVVENGIFISQHTILQSHSDEYINQLFEGFG